MATMRHVIPHSLVEEWNKALGEDIPKRSNLHVKSKALFVLWDDASQSRRDDTEALKALLEQRYRFEGESFFIPLEESQNVLQDGILQFINSFDTTPSLALIYYSGNGTTKHNRPIWLP